MKNKKFLIIILLFFCIMIAIISLFAKEKTNYQIQQIELKTPTIEEDSIGWLEGKITISNYDGDCDAIISACLTATPNAIVEQVYADADGNFIMYFANAGEYNITIQQNGYIKYEGTNLRINSGEILKLEDVTLVKGDINQDNEVELMDLIAVSNNYSTLVQEEYKKYDLNNDGKIDENDRNIVEENYGKSFRKQIAQYTARLIVDEPVARIGETTYTTLTAAIETVPTDRTETTITMLKSVSTDTAYSIPSTKNVKLDLNGKKISSSVRAISNVGTLTLIDNNRIKGKIVSTSTGTESVICSSGVLNINDIIIESSATYAVQLFTGTLNMYSGTVIGNGRCGIYTSSIPKIYIKGGKIEGKDYGIYAGSESRVYIGENDSIIDYDSIEIIGGINGLYSIGADFFYLYDGKIKGGDSAIRVAHLFLASGYKILYYEEDAYETAILIPSSSVALVEDTMEVYDTLNGAITSVDTINLTNIRMLENIVEENIIEEEKNIVLNLNGKTIESTNNSFEVFGSLNIINDVAGGKIVSSNGNAINNNGVVIIGTSENGNGPISITSPEIEGIEAIHINEGAITRIYDGKFIGSNIVDIDIDGTPWKDGAILGTITECEVGQEIKGYIENEKFVKVLKSYGPECTITSNVGTSINQSVVVFIFDFDEPVTGFTSEDIVISSGIKGTFTTLSKMKYTFSVSSFSDGENTITVPAGVCQAIDDNHNNKEASLTVNVDKVGPVITIAPQIKSGREDSSSYPMYTVIIYVADANLDVTSFRYASVYVSNLGGDGNSTVTPALISYENGLATYTISFVGDPTNSVANAGISVSIPSGQIVDTFGNGNAAATAYNSGGQLYQY